MQQRSLHVSRRARAGRPAAGAVAALVLAAGSSAGSAAAFAASSTAKPTTTPTAAARTAAARTTAAATATPTRASARPAAPTAPTTPARTAATAPTATATATATARASGAASGTALPGAGAAQDAAAVVGGERLGRPAVQVALRAGAPDLPAALTGRSWLIADAATGEVLAARNAHLPLPPASTLKMLFANTVLPRFDRALEHRVTPAELAELGAGSSLVGIKENLPYRVEDLWRGVFLASGNDAVHVLAHMNGGIARTVAQMQGRADALQARDTRVVSPDGYDQDGQVSSAYDLTLFARAGLRNPDFRAYCSTRTARFPGGVDKATGLRSSFDIANTDRLLGRYPGLIGVKNGYTTNAGATFTGAAERGGRTLLVTVMHPEQQTKVYDEAAALLDWGFAAAGKVEPVGHLVEEAGASAPAAASEAAEAPASGVLPHAIRQADHVLGPAGWTAVTLCGALALWAAARVRTRRRLHPRTAAGTALPGPVPGSAPTAAPTAFSQYPEYARWSAFPFPVAPPTGPDAPAAPHPPALPAFPPGTPARPDAAPRFRPAAVPGRAACAGATAVGARATGATAVGGRGRRRLARRARGLAVSARTRLTTGRTGRRV
ncbi:D-alanyl-D-alanine carboxypeptidase family protein [Kitasatospora sp. NPDC058201]|uniref:D-alanyl-D-alanine carboxypeptidase family protein n=1 Tax=unclassified Kitasatospora TaxID=2633591 RepID=UPI00365E4DC7